MSSHDHAGKLTTQAERLERHCIDTGFSDVEVITNLGRGGTTGRTAYRVCCWTSCAVASRGWALVTKDRLLRFGSELPFRICKFFHVEVVVLDAAAQVIREQKITEDLVEILRDFSARLYGSRTKAERSCLFSYQPRIIHALSKLRTLLPATIHLNNCGEIDLLSLPAAIEPDSVNHFRCSSLKASFARYLRTSGPVL
jgi:hypothetical protein